MYTKTNVNKQVNARVNQTQPQIYSVVGLMSQNAHYNYYLMCMGQEYGIHLPSMNKIILPVVSNISQLS